MTGYAIKYTLVGLFQGFGEIIKSMFDLSFCEALTKHIKLTNSHSEPRYPVNRANLTCNLFLTFHLLLQSIYLQSAALFERSTSPDIHLLLAEIARVTECLYRLQPGSSKSLRLRFYA